MVSADSEEIWGREEVTGQVVRNVGPSCCHQFPSRPVCNPVSANTARLNHSKSEVLNMLLHQFSYAMKTQLKTTKTPMGISCLSLCLYVIRKSSMYREKLYYLRPYGVSNTSDFEWTSLNMRESN